MKLQLPFGKTQFSFSNSDRACTVKAQEVNLINFFDCLKLLGYIPKIHHKIFISSKPTKYFIGHTSYQ